MDKGNPTTRDAAVAALYRAANRCEDAKLRGAMLALASVYEGVGFFEAIRVWGVDPPTLREVQRRFEAGGIASLSGEASPEQEADGA